MGVCPDWYVTLRKADRLHCKPWEVLEQSWWGDKALKAIGAENGAARQRQQQPWN